VWIGNTYRLDWFVEALFSFWRSGDWNEALMVQFFLNLRRVCHEFSAPLQTQNCRHPGILNIKAGNPTLRKQLALGHPTATQAAAALQLHPPTPEPRLIQIQPSASNIKRSSSKWAASTAPPTSGL
jgi:hypothetical protein